MDASDVESALKLTEITPQNIFSVINVISRYVLEHGASDKTALDAIPLSMMRSILCAEKQVFFRIFPKRSWTGEIKLLLSFSEAHPKPTTCSIESNGRRFNT
jgi:hypothetical protein